MQWKRHREAVEAEAPGPARRRALKAAGDFAFGHGLFHEAYSLYRNGGFDTEEEPQAAAAILDRSASAIAGLEESAYAESPRGALWAAFAHGRQGRCVEADPFLSEAVRQLNTAPGRLKSEIAAQIALCALESGRPWLAEGVAGSLPAGAPDTRFIKAWLTETEGYAEEAIAAYRALSARPDLTGARARLRGINIQWAEGLLDNTAAALALERLRYDWRGDDLEMQTIKALARVYLLDQKPLHAVAVLAEGVGRSSRQRWRDEMLRALEDGFFSLLEQMPRTRQGKLQAVELYERHRGLLRPGPVRTEIDQTFALHAEALSLYAYAQRLGVEEGAQTSRAQAYLRLAPILRMADSRVIPNGVPALTRDTVSATAHRAKDRSDLRKAQSYWVSGDFNAYLKAYPDNQGQDDKDTAHHQRDRFRLAVASLETGQPSPFSSNGLSGPPFAEILQHLETARGVASGGESALGLERAKTSLEQASAIDGVIAALPALRRPLKSEEHEAEQSVSPAARQRPGIKMEEAS